MISLFSKSQLFRDQPIVRFSFHPPAHTSAALRSWQVSFCESGGCQIKLLIDPILYVYVCVYIPWWFKKPVMLVKWMEALLSGISRCCCAVMIGTGNSRTYAEFLMNLWIPVSIHEFLMNSWISILIHEFLMNSWLEPAELAYARNCRHFPR